MYWAQKRVSGAHAAGNDESTKGFVNNLKPWNPLIPGLSACVQIALVPLIQFAVFGGGLVAAADGIEGSSCTICGVRLTPSRSAPFISI